MKSIFLLCFLSLPLAVWAQGQQPTIEQALATMANPRGLELVRKTTLYRQLSDTSSNRCALRLRSGGLIIIKKTYPNWLAVYRAASRIQFSTDTTTYYMRKSDAVGAKGFILL